uniref:Pecanex_C domain-containing protein n=1 Tax=Macrostomum lignano TaxID=282301 RepID=A0A1I8F566_9PLAT
VLQQAAGASRTTCCRHIFSGVSEEQGAGRGFCSGGGLSVANNVVAESVSELLRVCSICRRAPEFFPTGQRAGRHIPLAREPMDCAWAALACLKTDEVAQRPNLSFLEAVREDNMNFYICARASTPRSWRRRLNPRLVALRHTACSGARASSRQSAAVWKLNPARPGAKPWPPLSGHVRHALLKSSEQKAADFRAHQSAVQNGGASISGGATHACAPGLRLHQRPRDAGSMVEVNHVGRACTSSRSTGPVSGGLQALWRHLKRSNMPDRALGYNQQQREFRRSKRMMKRRRTIDSSMAELGCEVSIEDLCCDADDEGGATQTGLRSAAGSSGASPIDFAGQRRRLTICYKEEQAAPMPLAFAMDASWAVHDTPTIHEEDSGVRIGHVA